MTAGLRTVLVWTGVLAALGVLLMIVSPALAELLLYHPDPSDPGPPPPAAGVEGEVVTLTAEDGVRIRSWWYPVGEGAPVVVVFHGNAGNLSLRTPLAEGLVARGFSVLLAGYRGYGGSEGSPSEAGLYQDGRAALAFAAEHAEGPERVALLGRSLGGAVAAGVAVDRRVGALILDSAFDSLAGIAAAVYPFLPRVLFRRLRGRYDTLERVARIDAPLMVVHGEEDRLVPVAMGRALYEAAANPRVWLPVQGAGHNDLLLVAGEAYYDRIARFLREEMYGSDRGGGRSAPPDEI